jgi:hypothetical protein
MSEYIELSTITPSSSEESVFNQPSTSTGVRRRGGYVSIPINSSNSSISSAGSDSKLRVPNTPRVGGAVFGAGSQYQPIFEGQLGRAAADPKNPLSRAIFGNRDDYYRAVPWELRRLGLKERQEKIKPYGDPGQAPSKGDQHGYKYVCAGYFQDDYYAAVPWELRRLGLKERQEKIKPYGDPWNKDTKAKYPEHWRLVNPRRGLKKVKKQEEREAQARRDSANLARGEPPRNGLVLPYSNNIGPGNPIRPATNRADLIAQGHDLHYQQAKSDSDVLSADREAISQFAHEAVQGQDPISRIHAAVGGIGLGVKHAVEHLSGKVYYGKNA